MRLTIKQKEVLTKLEDLVMQRLDIKDITKKVQEIFNNPNIQLEDCTDGKDSCDMSDCNLIFSHEAQDELYGYFDIYFLPTRNPALMYLTEIGYEFE